MKKIIYILCLIFTVNTILADIPSFPINKINKIKYLNKVDIMPQLINNKYDRDDYSVKTIDIDSKKIVEIKVIKTSKNIWDQSTAIYLPESFEKNDIMAICVLMRCTDSKDESSMGRCTFEHNMPWTGKWIPSILNKTYSIQSDWQWFYIPYKSNKESKQVCLSLKVGVTKPQTLQIAQAFWYKFSKSTDINTLPNTKITYPGREENAQWRQDAFKRIEKIRKDDYTLTISNKGKPLQNVKVNIKLKHHKFGFALAISPKYFNEGYESKLEEILYSFNSIVIPNDFKWPFYKYKHCQIFIAKALEWSRQNDMINRGHCMVWGAWKHMPPHIEKLKNTPEKLKEAVLAHIKEMSIGTPPIVNQWDVINEPFTEKDLIKIFGDDIMVEMLKTVKEYNPNFKSYINDYGVISGTHKLHQDGLFNILKKLQEKNTPYDGIGFQAYYGSFPIAPTEILKRLDRFSVFGKEMYVTEYNMDQEDQDLFADYTRDLLILSFSYPAMTGFASWVEMWLPDGSPTKALKNWTQLIKETWDTDLIATTDNNGKIKFRGFRGSYNISFEIKKEKYKYFRDYSNTNINEIDIYDPFKTIK